MYLRGVLEGRLVEHLRPHAEVRQVVAAVGEARLHHAPAGDGALQLVGGLRGDGLLRARAGGGAHQSGMSVEPHMEAMLITGFRATQALYVSGYWPIRWQERKPPWEPPIRATRSLSKCSSCSTCSTANYRAGRAHLSQLPEGTPSLRARQSEESEPSPATWTSFTSWWPTLPGRERMLSWPKPVEPR